jgi:dolichol-phosphate mannosyltransferase
MSSIPVLVAIPTYNERANIDPLLALFREVDGNFDLLFVDDNSPDGTADYLDSLKSEWPNLNVMRRPGKLGVGSAHSDAIQYAYAHNYEMLATMDADLTHNPHSLVRMIELAKQGDVVVGSRFLDQDSLPGWNRFRRLLTHLGHFATCFFLKMPHDATGALRVYNLKTLPQGVFRLIRSTGYSFFYESLFVLWSNRYRVVEIPIQLPARTYGHSKMSVEQILISIFRLVLLYTNVRVAPELYRYAEGPAIKSSGTASSWDRYWGGAPKEGPADLAYEILATWFRMAFNKPFLDRVMKRHFTEGQTVLHAGCGSGQVDQGIRHWLKITACDLSDDAVRMYSQVNSSYCTVEQGDIMKLAYLDEHFDGVYNLGVMEHFNESEILAALREFHRVLKPKGKVVIFWPPLRSPIRHILKIFHLFAKLLDRKAKEPPYPPEISRVASREQGETWLKQAGFRPIETEFNWRDLYTQYAFVAEKAD